MRQFAMRDLHCEKPVLYKVADRCVLLRNVAPEADATPSLVSILVVRSVAFQSILYRRDCSPNGSPAVKYGRVRSGYGSISHSDKVRQEERPVADSGDRA